MAKKKSILKKEVHIPMPKKVSESWLGKFRKMRFPRYVRESIREVKKVTWPTRKEAWKLTFAVIVFTMVFTVFIVIADYFFQIIAERIFL